MFALALGEETHAHQTDISISLIMTVGCVDYHSPSIFSHFIWLLFVNNVNKAFYKALLSYFEWFLVFVEYSHYLSLQSCEMSNMLVTFLHFKDLVFNKGMEILKNASFHLKCRLIQKNQLTD